MIEKSTLGNPIAGFNDDGSTITYAGDPSILVDGDTVYLFCGHDTSSGSGYVMPNWVCYSTTDMVNWEYQGVCMDTADISWATKDTAWAGQVMKYNGKYYFYYCAQSVTTGNKEIAVAVADNPTGPYVDSGAPLFSSKMTDGTAYGATSASFSGRILIRPLGWRRMNPVWNIDICVGETPTVM